MKYYRCKCGKHEYWGSDSPANCMGCTDCNTTLEGNPERHKTPEPHQWKTYYHQSTGKPYQMCERCHERNADFAPGVLRDPLPTCCKPDCEKSVEWQIYWGNESHQSTEACEEHVGYLLESDVTNYVYPIVKPEEQEGE